MMPRRAPLLALLALLALLPLLAACGDETPSTPGTRVVEVAMFPATPLDKLDLLLQVDDSRSTVHLHDALATALPGMIARLGVAELQLGVVTSDLGTAGGPAVGTVGQGGCAGQGRDGMFATSTAVAGPFLVDGAMPNYTGELGEAIASLLHVGDDGCGFEQPLAATRRALARDTGFVRPDAALAVIVLADEDDCSIADPAVLELATDRFGPLQSFRCTRYGVVCNESLDSVGEKSGCEPWRASPYLEDPRVTSAAIDALKARPEHVAVGAIVGPASPFAVGLRAVDGAEGPALEPACRWDAGVADPAVRVASFVADFASRGALTSVCTLDLAPATAQIGLAIKRALGTACLETSQLADGSSAEGIQPACEVFDVTPGDPPRATALPRCPAAGDCYEIVADAAACPETADHARVQITRTAPPAADARVEVRCEAPLP